MNSCEDAVKRISTQILTSQTDNILLISGKCRYDLLRGKLTNYKYCYPEKHADAHANAQCLLAALVLSCTGILSCCDGYSSALPHSAWFQSPPAIT